MSLAALRQHRAAILALAAAHGVDRVRVFGSIVRGEAQEGSDIDLLVRVAPGTAFSTLHQLILALESLLRCPVDLIPEDGLSPHMAPYVEAEAIPL